MGIAGIYTNWRHPDGRELFSFAMLTVNADDHILMRRFHKLGEEKRMVVILDPQDYDDWLTCSVEDAPRYFKQWQGELIAEPDPLEASAHKCEGCPGAASGNGRPVLRCLAQLPQAADPTRCSRFARIGSKGIGGSRCCRSST